MKNGWTGGQYSLLRIALGAASCAALAHMAWHDAPAYAAGALLSLLFAIGRLDRWCAIGLAAAWAVRHPTMSVVFVLHALLPSAPYGSWAARGRVDPAGGWAFRPWVYAAAWMLLGAAGFVLPGVPAPVAIGVALAFGLLGFWAPARPVLWSAMAGAAAAWTARHGPDPAFSLLAMTFDPAWIDPRRADGHDRLFYDGTCGLCHRYVRLVLAEDAAAAFRLAPLDSDAFRREVPEAAGLPDSIIVRTADGRTLSRSTAIVRILSRLGGLWRVAGVALWLIPRPLRDLGYGVVAAIRYKLFARPAAACPILPPHLRERFLD